MGILDRMGRRWPKDAPLQVLPRADWASQRPTYRDADPAIIDAALQRSQRRPSGNWYAFAASTSVRAHRPFGTSVAGTGIVAWRDGQGRVHVGPGMCPHLGADLATGTIDCGALICPWHGLRLTGKQEFGWQPLPSHDDGVLVWVRLDRVGGEKPTEQPIIGARPSGSTLAAVTRLVGTCEP
ncbi:MAG TPA: Rieske (2Fe-2S) protein, partial [Mycobacterium sp.]|nr:Rieske (2Fe-2S) protein [Mycobacterium sp.]